MKIRKIFFVFALLVFSVFFGRAKNIEKELGAKDVLSYRQKAKQVYDKLDQYYKIDSLHLYLENYPKQENDLQCSYLWSLDGMLTASNKLLELGYRDASLNEPFVALAKYYDTNRQPAAYADFPLQYHEGKRFYDDNAIVANDLLERYMLTKDSSLLMRVESIVKFSLTGEDDLCGGGLYWNEQERYNLASDECMKAVCASAYSTTYLLQLYQITGQKIYLDFAKRLYSWLNKYIQDPRDNLYWNDIRVRDKYVHETKWTYNAGAMILNNVLFYEITKKKLYLTRAKKIAESCYKNFTKIHDGELFYPTHDSWFNICLFRGYLALAKYDQSADQFVDSFIRNADYAWVHARNPYGLFYEDWSGETVGRDKWLLQQACLAETYARIAIYKGEEI